ncbi:ammonia-forming cytochrome c nitrite reductase subunit c552 [Adlercreutzia faecimuris]|uniref:nitrite reductase (cytochrome; ammonia-forming) n=1 Tax=Adlercreutzia faecimuris TaxID=2897341 RepID=A0ABS9WGE1_9ACTN|nr:ammonia-forming cytochrome c nitrite reductase subunit c552 [Adlercreutzia sp. JBNU-10]MCI2241547.1 ammonia-forming cytochrome c nitrite reductase subunit c552 [Adlercreutzia sp. JBNU-10]
MLKSKKLRLTLAALCATVMVVGLAACAPRANNPAAPEADLTPAEDRFGVIKAEEWAGLYPHQYETWRANEANSPESGKDDYLETYPALRTMYKGYGFAKGYDEAASHSYTLRSIAETPRVTDATLANCITCKTPQFTALVNEEGDGVYAEKFSELIVQFDEPVSCYNCHGNDPTALEVTSGFYRASLGDAAESTPLEAQVCGQCHNEYYFNADKVTSNPYDGLAGMDAEAMLAFYDSIGFKDWEHPDTGAPLLKAQHPEFETVYGGRQSHMAAAGFSCADCHMATMETEGGARYASHDLVSPLESPELMEKCSLCHDDLAGEVAGWQKEVTDREQAISRDIVRYIEALAAARDALDPDTLARAQQIHRHAQFYWDYVMVENSEGAHNPEAAHANLDKAEALLAEGFALLA